MSISSLEKYLKAQGFDTYSINTFCPYQIEANHLSGLSIYFRSRGEVASLDIYDEPLDFIGELPDDPPILELEYECWNWPEAGYLEDNEALYVFYMLWADAKDIVFH